MTGVVCRVLVCPETHMGVEPCAAGCWCAGRHTCFTPALHVKMKVFSAASSILRCGCLAPPAASAWIVDRAGKPSMVFSSSVGFLTFTVFILKVRRLASLTSRI